MPDITASRPRPYTQLPGGVRELLHIALPMLISHACETMMMFVDRLFLAKIGAAQMSAAMGGGLTCFVFMTFFMGLTSYTNALVAQNLGAGRPQHCAVVTTQAFFIALAAAPVLVLCIPIGIWLFNVIGVAPEQLPGQQQYFRILMSGAVLVLLRNCLSSFFSGIGRTRIVMVAAAVAMLVNIGANYVLIYGKLGLPALGIRGAAIGTIIGSFAGLLVLLAFYFGARCRHDYDVVAALRYDAPLLRKLLRLGWPAGMEMFLNVLAFDLVILNFHSYGLAVAAAITITFNWDMVSFVPLLGLGIAVTSVVGRYIGAGKPELAQRATFSALKIAAVYCLAMFLAFCLFPKPLVEVFRPVELGETFRDVMPLAVFMVRLISVYVFADAVTIVFSSALRGAGDTFWTMVISVCGHWLLAGTAAVLIRLVHVQPRTAWLFLVVAVLLLGLSFYLRFRAARWHTAAIALGPAELSLAAPPA